ncbi:MAG: hydrogenase [Deltaproteobacteria bacterium]|nr:hydrogenase [Deltaproteobacteria bacterium]
MWTFLVGCGVIALGGLLALVFFKHEKAAKISATVLTVAGSALVAMPVIETALGADTEFIRLAWTLPLGEFHLGLDRLSAFFALPILLLSPLCAIYGIGYLAHRKGGGGHYFFLNTLVVSMLLLLCAKNAILFLIVWEVMAISSFFLVVFDDHLPSVRQAGWTYMIATHIGVMALLAFFSILGHHAGSFDFQAMLAGGELSSSMRLVLFLLAVVGFGSKAGIFPLHIWLPEAHPAAPSHVSALMSGVMIKMGIYGLMRSLSFLGEFEATFGWILLALGVAAGVVGIVSALSSHDIKRMLAYSSVENIGIICIGLGTGILGSAWHNPQVTALGFGGALLHVLNHSMFKGLLFLTVGAVVHETDTKEMHHMGGLLKKMPFTAVLFFAGAMAASALPPFNGFVSEFLIYFSGIKSAMTKDVSSILLAAVLLTSLALIGGLALAAFTKVGGMVFLGEPRTALKKTPHDPGWTMKFPLLLLGIFALGTGIASPLLLPLVSDAQTVLTGDAASLMALDSDILPSLINISYVSGAFLVAFVILAFFYRILTGRKKCEVARSPVWDCGYAKPAVSMQYTPSSFSAPLVLLFKPLVHIRWALQKPEGYFPKSGRFETKIEDRVKEAFYAPLFRLIAKTLLLFRFLQHGHVHIYVIYVAVTLIALLLFTAGN